MNDSPYMNDSGPFEARYLAFLETISTLRPSLHRYYARMLVDYIHCPWLLPAAASVSLAGPS